MSALPSAGEDCQPDRIASPLAPSRRPRSWRPRRWPPWMRPGSPPSKRPPKPAVEAAALGAAALATAEAPRACRGAAPRIGARRHDEHGRDGGSDESTHRDSSCGPARKLEQQQTRGPRAVRQDWQRAFSVEPSTWVRGLTAALQTRASMAHGDGRSPEAAESRARRDQQGRSPSPRRD